MKSRRSAGRQAILVPVDGSAASRRAIAQAIAFGRKLRAEIVGLHVITPFELTIYVNPRPAIVTAAEFEKRAGEISERILSRVTRAATAARVPCRCRTVWDTQVADTVLRAAREHGCGLIVMATHGRTGLQRVLLGSVTQKVLAKSRVPVLICP